MTSSKKILLGGASTLLLISTTAMTASGQETTPDTPVITQPSTLTTVNDDEIVVTGVRSSIENSLETKRKSDSIMDSLSADQADRFPDNNIGEALARIPGISFQRDNNSGDGEFISIRGLDAQYNTVLHNGLRTGTSDTFRRSALDVITGNNVSSIDVIKAPLPEHASEGIGGIIDIKTRGALDRRERTSASASITNNSFAEKNGYRFGGTVTKHLSDTVGINLSARYRKRYITSFQINPATSVPDLLADITLDDVNGNPITFSGTGDLELVPTEFLDIRNFNTEQINYTHDDIERDQITVSGNIDWEVSPTTKITFGGRHDEKKDIQDTNTIEFDVDNNFRGGVNTWRDPEINFRGAVEDDEETETRLFLRSETKLEKWDINLTAGWSRAYRDRPFKEINFEQELEETPSSPGTGTQDERDISFAPFDLSIGNGLFPGPVPLNQTVFLEALDPFCQDGGSSCGEIADFNYEIEDSRENTRYTARLDLTRDFSENGGVLQNIKFGGQWETSDYLDRDIDVSFVDDTVGPNGEFLGTDATNGLSDSNVQVGDLGLLTNNIISFDPIGNPFKASGFVGIPQYDSAALRQMFAAYEKGFFASGVDPRESEIIEASEKFLSAYIQGKWTFNKLDVVGGARIEQYDADFAGSVLFAVDIDFDDVASGTADDSVNLIAPQSARVLSETSNFEFLPRIALNYNISDKMKLRAAYTTAIARPTFDLLAGRIDGDFNIDVADGVDIATATINDITFAGASFDLGNPDLRNSYAKNFDISFEYYADKQNAFSIAVFRKEIDDFIFSSFVSDAELNQASVADPGALFASINLQGLNGFDLLEQLGGFEAIAALPGFSNSISQAQNGGRATIEGIELGVFHAFDYLPGFLSHFGVIGNATFTKSKTDINLGTLGATDALVQLGLANAGDDVIQEFPFFNSPEAIYNATLFYDYKGLEVNLSYRNSGVQLEEIEAFGISQFQQGRTFIDLDVEYTFKRVGPFNRVTFYLEANDLTDTGQKPSVFETRGKTRAFNDNSTFNGRTFTFGTRVRF